MLYVYTDISQEQKQLQVQFDLKNNYYLIPSKQSYFLSEMLASISHEFFQNKVPTLVDKIKELLIFSFSKIYSLNSYRDLMKLVKKQQDDIQMYREHLIEMNRAFAEDNLDLGLDPEDDPCENNDFLFQEALKGESHQLESLDLLELPLASELNFQLQCSDTKTEKTMQSDLWGQSPEKEVEKMLGFTSNSLENAFSSSGEVSFYNWKNEMEEKTKVESNEKLDSDERDHSGSQQMHSFKRRGSTIYSSNKNLREFFVPELRYDLNRQTKLGSGILEGQSGSQFEKFNLQKKIRSTLISRKLKQRRK